MDTLSNRACELIQSASPLHINAFKFSQQKPYCVSTNPHGMVNCGVSENYLMDDMLQERMSAPDMTTWKRQYQYYFDSSCQLRQSLGEFFQERLAKNNPNIEFDPSDFCIINGASASFTAIANSVADRGEYIMIQTPYYSAISYDVQCLTGNKILAVESKSDTNFNLTIGDYKRVYDQACAEKKTVKGICLVNPQNPLGIFYSKEFILDLLQFANERKLHVIFDEIYANCVYENSEDFVSIFSIYPLIPDPDRTHFIWSFSKDFCLAGYRCGVIYTQNKLLMRSIKAISLLIMPPLKTQDSLAIMLGDKPWVERFFNVNIERIRESKRKFLLNLDVKDVRIYESNSGLYLWADFRKILSPSMNGDELTFDRELNLFDIIFNKGVYVVPGQFLACSEPGWFRIIFTVPDDSIKAACERIKESVLEFLKS